MRRTRILAALLLLASAGLSSCVSFSWSRSRAFRPLPKGGLDGLETGRTSLAECLQRLGSPLYVWEYKGDGAALAWGFSDEDSKSVSVNVQVLPRFRPSFSYGEIEAKLRGAVLLFDDALVLEEVKEGFLRNLEGSIRRVRPAPVEDEAGP